jgi:hypothetical protein
MGVDAYLVKGGRLGFTAKGPDAERAYDFVRELTERMEPGNDPTKRATIVENSMERYAKVRRARETTRRIYVDFGRPVLQRDAVRMGDLSYTARMVEIEAAVGEAQMVRGLTDSECAEFREELRTFYCMPWGFECFPSPPERLQKAS